MTFEQTPELHKRTNHPHIWKKRVLDKWSNKGKGSGMRTAETRVARVQRVRGRAEGYERWTEHHWGKLVRALKARGRTLYFTLGKDFVGYRSTTRRIR